MIIIININTIKADHITTKILFSFNLIRLFQFEIKGEQEDDKGNKNRFLFIYIYII